MTPQPSGSATAEGPLAGIRVLDFSSILLGPLATRILGDYGAEVIKIETLEGDMMRSNGSCRSPGMSSIHLALNRNKRSLAVNLKREEGKEIAMRLLPTADVVVHNMRVRAMETLGLGYEAVKRVNPRIVYCAATSFGQTGPYANKPAFDDVIQAASGIASLMGGVMGRPGYVPTVVADKSAGMALANAVLAALVYRGRTGLGQYVEVPMFETLVDYVMVEHLGGMTFLPTSGPAGYPRVLPGGRSPAQTRDGYIAILPYNHQQWHDFLVRSGHEYVIAKYDFSSRAKLNTNVLFLYDEMARFAPMRTTAEWMAICEELDIAATPIYSLEELPTHPHLKAVGLFEEAEHPTEGLFRQVRPTTIFGASPASIRCPAPNLGQDTQSVLQELGYDKPTIARLASGNVINCGMMQEEGARR